MRSPNTHHHRRRFPHGFALPTLLILLCLGFPKQFGLAARAPDAAESPLADVPALDQRVTLSKTHIPLGELIRQVVGETGATLRAAAHVADESVVVVMTRGMIR